MDTILKEAKLWLAILVELAFGFLTGLLILGLIPNDGVDFNVIGSVLLAIPCAVIYHLAGRYVTARVPGRK